MKSLPAAKYFLAAALLALAGCGNKPTTLDDFSTQPLTLPSGQKIRVETMINDYDLLRGLMFRKSLPPDRGMLFVHATPDRYKFWMYQTLIPLDMIWMDSNRRIVEIVADVQPCNTQASRCPQYGGNELSMYTLELPAGMARKFGLQLGQSMQW